MSGGTKAEELYSAIEESARLVGAACSRARVWPVLTAYQDTLAEGGIVFSAQTGNRSAGELDYAFTVAPEVGDPYVHALSNGFVAETDHPVCTVLSEVRARCAVSEHFADCGVVSGFRKLYAHFPRSLQSVSTIADMPSMPRAVAENAGLFARYGLNDVAMVGVNYKQRTISLYFQFSPETRIEPRSILSMLRAIRMPDPNKRMLDFAHRAFRANITLSWDSSEIVRVTFAPPPGPDLDLSTVPYRMEPHLERFVTSAPRAYAGKRMNLFAVKWTREGEFVEVCSYYRLPAGYEPIRLMGVHEEQD